MGAAPKHTVGHTQMPVNSTVLHVGRDPSNVLPRLDGGGSYFQIFNKHTPLENG